MAEAANASGTPTQLINIGIIIITNSTIFSNHIRKWHIRPDNEKTWPNFKDHFKAAQKDIKKSQPEITTNSLDIHEQANAATLVDQVINHLATEQDNATTITEESVTTNAATTPQDGKFHPAEPTNAGANDGSDIHCLHSPNTTQQQQYQQLLGTILRERPWKRWRRP
jgi:hypothetical protein